MTQYLTLQKDDCNFLDVTRFIGIYLVIFAHFMFSYHYSFISGYIFSFHMPLFFIVSGILHRDVAFSKQALWRIVYALLIPYLLYNLIGLLYLYFFSNRSVEFLLNRVISTLLGENPITGASWFLLALFWSKFWSLFLHSKKAMIVFSLICIAIVLLYDNLQWKFAHNNLLMLRTALASFPFFTIGYLIQDFIRLKIKNRYILILALLFGLLHLVFWYSWGSLSMGEMKYHNLLVIYPTATFGSLALLYVSRLLVSYLSCPFVKDISRGTMIIVGLHFFVIYEVLVDYTFKVMPLRYIALWSIVILLGFYVIIKLTYNRLPILYGKKKSRGIKKKEV